MPEPTTPAANPETAEPSIIKDAGEPTLLAGASDEEKQAQTAEEKRLLEADETTLSEEDKGKRATLVKAQEEKKLIETPDDKLSEEDKVKKAEIVKTKEAEAKAKVVPEKYEFKIPEGMTLDQAAVDKFSPLFKELKISQVGAQKLVDIYIETQKAQADAQAENFRQFLKESYDETVKSLGAKYKAELAYVAKVRDRFLSEETQEMLDASGLSNNKAFILDLINIGRLISEDKLATGRSETPAGSRTAADLLYPEQGKK